MPAAALRWVHTAASWGIAPTLRRIVAPQRALARPASELLDALARDATARALRLATSGARGLAAVLDAGIPAACFKGLAMVARSRTLPQRSMSDVDILVPETALRDTLAVLDGVGFRLRVGVPLDAYVDFIRSAPHFSGNRAVPMVDPHGNELDLHWGFGEMCGPSLQADAVLARSVPASLFGYRVRCFSRTDLLLFAAHHAMRENFAPTATVKNLLDIDRLDDSREPLDTEVVANAGAPATALVACSAILARWHRSGGLRVHLDSSVTASTRTRANDLAEVFERQLDAAPINRDIVHMLHGTTVLGVLRTAFLHPQRNRAIMEALGGLPDAQRLRRLMTDLRRLSLTDVRLYRSLARAKRTRIIP